MRREEFLNYVNVQGKDDCWPWLGAQNGRGYGRLEYEGKYQQAHRVSYQIHCEPIPEGYNVLHTCDNAICVNPEHLFLGTQQDNVDDMAAKGRAKFGGKQRGEQSVLAKLKDVEVIEIKKLLTEGYSHSFIADRYGVARQTIGNIASGHRWSHI